MRLKDTFIKNLRKYRKNGKITQMALAEQCGTSTSYIGQIEIGNRFPSLEMIEKIAKALEIRPYMLFFDESNEDTIKQLRSAKTNEMSDNAKDELIDQLTHAIRKVVKKANLLTPS